MIFLVSIKIDRALEIAHPVASCFFGRIVPSKCSHRIIVRPKSES